MNSRTMEIVEELSILDNTGMLEHFAYVQETPAHTLTEDEKILNTYVEDICNFAWKNIIAAYCAAFINDDGTIDPYLKVFMELITPPEDIRFFERNLFRIGNRLKKFWCAEHLSPVEGKIFDLPKAYDDFLESKIDWFKANDPDAIQKYLKKKEDEIYPYGSSRKDVLNIFSDRIQWCWDLVKDKLWDDWPKEKLAHIVEPPRFLEIVGKITATGENAEVDDKDMSERVE